MNKNKTCIDCGIIIDVRSKRCKPCNVKGKRNPMFGRTGKKNPNHKDGRTLKKYYCKNCGKEITWRQALYRKPICLSCARTGRNNSMFGKIAYHGKWELYGGVKMRSSWEVIYAKWLDANRINWKFGYKTFDLGTCTYTPDFYLPDFNEYIEVKGWWRDDAKNKFDLFRKQYPKINIYIRNKVDIESCKEDLKIKGIL